VAGDQVPTDGVLPYRLRFTFLHYTPLLAYVPAGPGLIIGEANWCARCCSGGLSHRGEPPLVKGSQEAGPDLVPGREDRVPVHLMMGA
jgi:hypothetical protein